MLTILELEEANLALQNKIDILERKIQMQETALKKLNRERDMAVSQLGVAYLESQDLKTENDDLRAEIAELNAQLTKLASFVSKTREETQQSEQASVTEESTDDSQVNTRRSTTNMSRGTKELTNKSSRSRSKARREDSRAMVSNQVNREISRLEKEQAEEALFSIDLPRAKSQAKKSESRSKAKKQPNTGKQRVKRVVVEEVDVTDPVDSTTEATGNTKRSTGTEQEMTLLSFVDVSLFFLTYLSTMIANPNRNVRLPSFERLWKKNGWPVRDASRVPLGNTLQMKPRIPPSEARRRPRCLENLL